jgi:ferredoxin--NADP+ reductase
MGYTTRQMARLEVEDSLCDVVGPLGQPTEVEQYGRVVCVGGGVGIAAIYPIAKALKEAGNQVISIIGARSQEYLILRQEMEQVSDCCLVATDDGSAGQKGFVTDVLSRLLEEPELVNQVWAVGPMIMMRAVTRVTQPHGVKTMVSLNPIMVDGTGMCGACRVTVGGETRFACVDGPEFDGHLVDWDEAMSRLNSYRDQEQIASHQCRLGGDHHGS